MRNLPDHNRVPLREFFRMDSKKAYADQTLLSRKTTRDLKLTSAKYHLGCILFCGEQVYDRCISSLTSAGNKNMIN
jgi:hypothetical protein